MPVAPPTSTLPAVPTQPPPHQPAAQAVLPALPGLPSLTAALDRGWDSQAAQQEPSAPALVRGRGDGRHAECF